jgi:preprotein translocase subunit SecB
LIAKKKASVPQAAIRPEIHPRFAFIKSVKFTGIGLDKSNVFVNRDLLTKARDGEDPLEIELAIRQHVVAHEKDYFVVGADFDLTQRTKSSDDKIVSISATFSARFELTKPANESLLKAFAALEARLIFFPYLRHFVSDISYRMAIDTIVLPMTSEFEG